MNRILTFLIGIFLSTFTFAQNFELDYTPIQNKGKIPKDILVSSSLKYKSKKKKVTGKKKNKQAKISENKFYLKNSFVIDELLHSGRVNFSDEITQYVQKVADELLKNDKKLRKKLKFYTVRSSIPNAFATDRGIIFVNLGLLAKLNTEAELAFILSHEITHYTKKHNLKSKITLDEIQREKKKLRFKREGNKFDALLKTSNYSKKLELEADRLGLKTFLKSDWDVKAIDGVFDVLEYAHTPFIETKVTVDFLNLEGLTLPKKYFLEGVDELVSMLDKDENDEDDDDAEDQQKYSTHPGIEERRAKIESLLGKSKQKNGKSFIISESDFNLAKQQAQFEICQILLQDRSYTSALYHSYALQQVYPKNKYLKRVFTFALYGIAQYVNDERHEIIPSEKDIQGEMQQVIHVLDKLSDKNINLIAVRHIWDFYKSYPKDKGMEKMVHDMVEDMVIYQINKPKTYFKASKMKSGKKKDFARVAFKDIANDKEFKKMLKDGVKYKRKFDENEAHPQKKKSYQLGFKKAVFLDPNYYMIDNANMDYIESEKRQKQFVKAIKRTSKMVGLKPKIVQSRSLSKKNSIKDFNDMVVLKRWSNEVMNNMFFMINSNYNDVQKLTQKYKTKNLVITGNVALEHKPNYLRKIFWLVPPLTPIGLAKLRKEYYGLVYTYVLDMKTNEVRMVDVNYYDQKASNAVLEMNLYAAFQQITAKGK